MAFDKLLLPFHLTKPLIFFLVYRKISTLFNHTHHEQIIQISSTEREEFKPLKFGDLD